MPKVRWVLLYGFCSTFHTLSSNAKRVKSDKIWQSYGEYKGWNFFETQCRNTLFLAADTVMDTSSHIYSYDVRGVKCCKQFSHMHRAFPSEYFISCLVLVCFCQLLLWLSLLRCREFCSVYAEFCNYSKLLWYNQNILFIDVSASPRKHSSGRNVDKQ